MPIAISVNGAAIAYVYLVVKCAGCKFLRGTEKHIILKYLGVYAGRAEYDLPQNCPYVLTLRCCECNKITRYLRNGIFSIALPWPPGPDFHDLI